MSIQKYIVLYLTMILIKCQQSANKQTPLWQILSVVFGILLIGIVLVVYFVQRRRINMTQILKGYVLPISQTTFVNIQAESKGQTVIDSNRQQIQELQQKNIKQNQIMINREQQYQMEQPTKKIELATVFYQQNTNLIDSTGIKKSKSKKRLANSAKLTTNSTNSNEEDTQISQDEDMF